MKFNLRLLLLATITTLTSVATTLPAKADTPTPADCSYYPNGANEAQYSMRCTLSMHQGIVHIQWQDGTQNDFTPTGSEAGVFQDQYGGTVYRQAGNSKNELIFKMQKGRIYVRWLDD